MLAELDYLLLRRLGRKAEGNFLAQLVSGAIVREPTTDADITRAREIVLRFDDQELGLTDAALMAVAERLQTRRVLTLDHRHFAAHRDRKGRAIEILPR